MRLRACPRPPFWDELSHWPEAFQVHLDRFIQLRSMEHLEACEHLEDLLAAWHERRAEILRVTAYQIVLSLPPIGRRAAHGELKVIYSGLARRLFGGLPLELQAEALEETGWPRGTREWVLQMSPRVWPLGPDPEGTPAPFADDPRLIGPGTANLLRGVIQGLSEAENLLPVPTTWVGSSCLDLRLEHLSALAEDHLARWPVPEDLALAVAALSRPNRSRVLALFPDGKLQNLVDRTEQGSPSWRTILQAQRRIAWWLELVHFKVEILELYEALKTATSDEARRLCEKAELSSSVLSGIQKMVDVYGTRKPPASNT